MKLKLKIEQNGLELKLVTPDGEEIDNVRCINLQISDNDFAKLTVVFDIESGSLDL